MTKQTDRVPIPDSPLAATRRARAVALLTALNRSGYADAVAANRQAPRGDRRSTIDRIRDDLLTDMEALEKDPSALLDGDTRTVADFLAALDALGALWAVS